MLGTCVACKACKAECPAGVDMAALKVEWLAELRARRGVPPLARAIGDFRRLAALVGPIAPAVNALARTRAARRLATLAGVAAERPLPSLARRPLSARLDGRGAGVPDAAMQAGPTGPLTGPRTGPRAGAETPALTRPGVPDEWSGAPGVVLFADCFVEHQEPEIGEAFVRILAAAAGRS